jgi:hypothetical protein
MRTREVLSDGHDDLLFRRSRTCGSHASSDGCLRARNSAGSRESWRPFKGIFCDDISEIAVDTVIAVNGFFD